MKALTHQYENEQTGISYTLSADGNYYIPNFTLVKQEEYVIGRYGHMRLRYLKAHRRALYANLLMSGKLNEHLYEIDLCAHTHMELIGKQIAEREGVTEQLKVQDQMLWVQKMNDIRHRVDEVIREELVYA